MITLKIHVPHIPDVWFYMVYDPESSVQRDMANDIESGRGYEPGTWQTFQWLLRPGDTVVDVGAHVGTFSCLAAALVGKTGHVQAFEPNTQNRKALVANRERNGFDHLSALRKGVSDVDGRAVFYRCVDNDGGHALWNPALSDANIQTKYRGTHRIIDTVTLDHDGPPACRLLKIDTEGAEANIIKGAKEWLKRTRPAIIAEINAVGLRHMGSSEDELREFIRSFAYDEYGIQDSAPFYVPVDPDQSLQPMGMQNGRKVLFVFNMLFIPREWPEAEALRSGQSMSAASLAYRPDNTASSRPHG